MTGSANPESVNITIYQKEEYESIIEVNENYIQGFKMF
jgi:hypothetical protein